MFIKLNLLEKKTTYSYFLEVDMELTPNSSKGIGAILDDIMFVRTEKAETSQHQRVVEEIENYTQRYGTAVC